MAKVASKAAKKAPAKKAAVTRAQKATQRSKTAAVKAAGKRLQAPAKRVAKTAEPLTHRLDALLHTMRCIAQHEDQLCGLLHDARRSGRVSAALRRELQTILSELPAEEYTDDLHAVLEIAEAV